MELAEKVFSEDLGSELGSIAVRVVVLPPKDKTQAKRRDEKVILDQEEHEDFLQDKSSTPVGSYLESSKGRRCVVFLVNGQAQDYLDNSFIVNELGFKYLRNRMIIAIDVDELAPETKGLLMQSSRQGFLKGHAYEAIKRKIVSTLKNDPDLERLELEAESKVAELEAGDAKVKEYLDQLIESHHSQGMHLAQGEDSPGLGQGDSLADSSVGSGKIVSLFQPQVGDSSDYPVLVSEPAIVAFQMRPNTTRAALIKANPRQAWRSLSKLTVHVADDVPELRASVLHLPDRADFSVQFVEPEGFDPSNYPISTKVVVTGKFDEIDEPRQLTFGVVVKPATEVVEPELLDVPTKLLVTSRQPVKLVKGATATHVKLRWDGKDHLLAGVRPTWALKAQLIGEADHLPDFTFSDPVRGRFDLVIRAPAEWDSGTRVRIGVQAIGPNQSNLEVEFDCEVVETPQRSDPAEPRLIEGRFPAGASRRPPYVLRYLYEKDYEETPCWTDFEWSGAEPACYIDPTDSTPLTIIINNDFTPLKTYKNLLIKQKKAESEVERRVTKYTSHVAFHLYQMYLASKDAADESYDVAQARRRKEIERVAMTLIRLMEISR